jgi:hypothetical protein
MAEWDVDRARRQDAVMADAVAIASVISTATIGVASLLTQAWITRRNHEHQRQLAIEQRQADAQKEARDSLVALTRWCIELRARLEGTPTDELMRYTGRTWELDAQLVVHLAPEVQTALQSLDAVIRRLGSMHFETLMAIGQLRAQKEEALDDEDLSLAAALRDQERQLIQEVQPDVDEAKAALDKFRSTLHAR